jgi:gliding motility-associated-like protein
VAVYIYSPPTTADAGTDQLVHTPFTYLHAVAPTIGSGSWSVLSGAGSFENPNDPQTRVFNLGSGENVLRWTTSNGVCVQTTDDVRIESDPLIIPTGYSPNDDGVNDQFEIVGLLEYNHVSLEVFNRWGNKVFTSANYRNDWNGISDNQQILPDDVYYYVLALEDGTTFNGYVAIKRTKP